MAIAKRSISQRSFLLPGSFRLPGFIIAIIGCILLLLRFYYHYQPSWLDTRVFAIFSIYVEAKYFSIIRNQVMEEVGAVLLFSGLVMMVLSRKKWETTEVDWLRLKAFKTTLFICTLYLLLSLLFVYGFGYVMAMLIFPVILFAAYVLVFEWKYYKKKRLNRTRDR